MGASFTSPVDEPAAPIVGLILHVEQARPTRYSTRPAKCQRCHKEPGELVIRFWDESDLGAPEYVRSCRPCLTDTEVLAWRSGSFYRVRREPVRPWRTDRPLRRSS